ncbi:hypothetical protein PENTCL1PPCAC_30509, partial [Pristionchus entomophagus]
MKRILFSLVLLSAVAGAPVEQAASNLGKEVAQRSKQLFEAMAFRAAILKKYKNGDTITPEEIAELSRIIENSTPLENKMVQKFSDEMKNQVKEATKNMDISDEAVMRMIEVQVAQRMKESFDVQATRIAILEEIQTNGETPETSAKLKEINAKSTDFDNMMAEQIKTEMTQIVSNEVSQQTSEPTTTTTTVTTPGTTTVTAFNCPTFKYIDQATLDSLNSTKAYTIDPNQKATIVGGINQFTCTSGYKFAYIDNKGLERRKGYSMTCESTGWMVNRPELEKRPHQNVPVGCVKRKGSS